MWPVSYKTQETQPAGSLHKEMAYKRLQKTVRWSEARTAGGPTVSFLFGLWEAEGKNSLRSSRAFGRKTARPVGSARLKIPHTVRGKREGQSP